MGKKQTTIIDPLLREKAEKELIERIKVLEMEGTFIKLGKYNNLVYMDAQYIADPIPLEEAQNHRRLFSTLYDINIIKNKFTIKESEINKMLNANNDKKFLHVFFINDKVLINTLSLVFRFSDISDFDDISKLDIQDYNQESAYWLLQDGTVEIFNEHSTKFTDLCENFEKGIGKEIIKTNDFKLTNYITYEVPKILYFKGFEQDVIFEVVCNIKDNRIRLALQTYIIDYDRVHHYDEKTGNPIYEGYYDLGNLKP